MFSAELCPGLQYPSLKTPSWHCRSGLSGPLLLTSAVLLKTEVLTAVGTTPSHYFCLCPPFAFPMMKRQKYRLFFLLVDSIWTLWKGSERVPRNCQREVASVSRDLLGMKIFFAKWLNEQVRVFGHNWRGLGVNFIFCCRFKIN